MRKLLVILLLALVAGAVAGGFWWFHRPVANDDVLVLYGNLDLRQVQLAFNNSERIASVKVEEGDRVKKGDTLAELDTSRLEPLVAQAKAQAAAQQEVYRRLSSGSRPEEKSQARANVKAAEVDVVNARRHYERLQKLAKLRATDLSELRGVSQDDIDNAQANLEVAQAKLIVIQKTLDLTLLGPRQEEVQEAQAKWQASQAQFAYLTQQLADAKLVAPVPAVVRARLMEPGEMATPSKAVFSLAVIDPKWVRAYVAEPDLGKIREKMKAAVTVDSFPDRRFEGWVGFISPVAEFTPKTVQTEQLRPTLVYEVRVFVRDPDDVLRLGMPATVHVPLK